MKIKRILRVALLIGMATCLPAFGQFAPITSPVPTYTGGTTLINIAGADGTIVNSIADGTETVTLSQSLSEQTVPGGGWGSWGSPPNTEGNTPRVLAVFSQVNSFTMTLSVPMATFGFEVEPDNFVTATINASFYNGGTLLGTVSRQVAGNAGALVAGASSSLPITSIVVTFSANSGGFAVARLRYGSTFLASLVPAVPALTPAAFTGLALCLAAAGSLLARRAKQTAA